VLLMQEPNDPTMPAYKAAPHAMNAAFALEIYFKCLWRIDNTSNIDIPKIHDLLKLFHKIIPARQTKICEFAKEQETIEPIPADMKAAYPALETVEGCLAMSAKAFEIYRYGYERNPFIVSGVFVAHIQKATRRLLLGINPNWA